MSPGKDQKRPKGWFANIFNHPVFVIFRYGLRSRETNHGLSVEYRFYSK